MLATLAGPHLQAGVTWSPVDDRWYREIGGNRSDSGMVIVPEAALSVAVVYRAVSVLAHSVASIPLVIYRRTGEDGKERAREHPAYDLLHDQPNVWITSFRWRQLMMAQAILWGNHYSEILPGPGGIGALAPLSPDATRIVDQLSDGRLVYLTRDLSERGWGVERRLIQDNVLHVRGFSLDGKSGLPLTRMARNAMGLALTAEKHGSMFLRKGARLSGILTSPSPMNEEKRKENERAWAEQYGGPDQTGKTPLLTGGITYSQIASNNRDSQWQEARTFQVEELLRFLGVPGVLCGYADKTATYASAESFFLSFVTHSVRPWTENIAQELNATVIVDSPRHFCDFVLEGLLKGDIKTRYDAYRIGIAAGFLNRNEVRVKEDMNRGPAELDEFMEPLNMIEAGAERDGVNPAAPNRPPEDEAGTDDEDGSPRAGAPLRAIAEKSARRLVRKEFVAMLGNGRTKGAATRYADNPDGWTAWLTTFYEGHADLVGDELGVPTSDARAYCDAQRHRFAALANMSAGAESDSVAHLTRITPGLENGHA